jgi:transcriptional regulator with XRE-family HTH domain
MLNLNRVEHRRALADFVRSRRERTRPEDVGLPAGPRRRTPGLRREEVAHLAGVGITWYTWFEQGRDIQVSSDFLERLCRGFRLDAAERGHLYTLAQHRPPPHAPLCNPEISAPVRAVLDAISYPAYIKTPRWDVVAWNAAAIALFGDFGALPVEDRNILMLVFKHARFRRMMGDWEGDARHVMAKFRLDFGRAQGDAAFVALVDHLLEASAEFHQWWPRQDVWGQAEGSKRLHHDELGGINFEHTAFAVEGAPDLRLVAYAPASPDDAVLLRRLLDRPA